MGLWVFIPILKTIFIRILESLADSLNINIHSTFIKKCRTGELFGKLKVLFGTVQAIPVQVFLTGYGQSIFV